MKKVYKVLLIGSRSRTDIINKAKKLHLSSEHTATAGMTSFSFDVNKEKIVLQVWEASSSEKFRSILPMYCKDLQGVAFVFDINQRSTFDEIAQLIPIAQSKSPKDACFFLIGVMCEKEEDRQIPNKEVAALVKQYHLKSAKFSPKDESSSILFSIARILHNPKTPLASSQHTEPPPKPANTTSEPPPSKPQPIVIEKEPPQPTDQSPQSLSRQLTIAQKHEKFYQSKAADMEQKVKELTEKLEESMNNEKKLTEKVNYLTKKLHTVTLQKIHQEECQNDGIPTCLVHNELPILTVAEIDSLKKSDEMGSSKATKTTVTKVIRDENLTLRTFEPKTANVPATEAETENPTESGESAKNEHKIEKEKIDEFVKVIDQVNKFGHPCIVKNVGFCSGDDAHAPSLLTEFVDSNLSQSAKGMASNDRALAIYAISATMKFAHSKSVFHKKLSPQNILVDSKSHRVKIADFGLEKVTDFEAVLGDQSSLNFHFLAPEILNGKKIDDCDAKVDVFAFGSLVFFILTGGELPSTSLEEAKEGKVPEIPSEINEFSRDLILKCWKLEPNERPSFGEIVESIEKVNFMLLDDFDSSQLVL